MQVWADENRNLQALAESHAEVSGRLSAEKLKNVFALAPFLRNLDAIYKRLALE
jgi:hypothetical protein